MCNREYESELKIKIEELEKDIEDTETKMKRMFKSVCEDIKNAPPGKQFSADELFTVAARACSIVGISIEEQKEIEEKT